MRKMGYCLLLIIIIDNSHADELEDWILPETHEPILVGFTYQQNEDSDKTTSASLSIPLKGVSVLDISGSQSRFSDGSSKFTSEAFDTRLQMDVSPHLSLLVSYNTDGHDRQLEINHYGLGFRYFHNPLYIEIVSEDGQLALYSRNESGNLRQVPKKSEMSKDGVAVTIGWWMGDFTFELFHQYYDYGKNIAALGDSTWLQLLVKPEVLSLSNLLIDEQSRITLSYLNENHTLSVHWISDVSAVDKQRLDACQLDYGKALTETTEGLISISGSEDSDWSIAMGLIWRL